MSTSSKRKRGGKNGGRGGGGLNVERRDKADMHTDRPGNVE